METNKASEAPSKRVYEFFEPYCKWKTSDEGTEILEIELKGFKREQLKVQANEKGMLIVSGERPVSATKWIRFRKETTLPKDCNYKDIRAKLSKGFLSILMPTKLPTHQLLPPPPENDDDSEEAQKKKYSIWGVKIDKGRFFKVAVVVTAVVLVVAIARLAEVYRRPHDAAKDHVPV
ncbi:inactive protein RESTRICTED TEV MOVEMENT 2-like [Neltuma alba]|uniref:inactive protein RESTRICTED TEV MOVEMENT 2-like n=1 Tax=Neltuma alba TaxID=207710 RepID=UPI0010A48E9D|nr:inactive protein RESTRICTED TEV MOVEMENT 2-like [Prosopis alba]